MRKGFIKGIVLFAIFVLAVYGFSGMTNRTNEDMTREMAFATLPLVTLSYDEREVNELHGYAAEMDVRYVRDTITPLGEDRTIPVEIELGARELTGIAYQIRSLDGEELLVDSEITDFSIERGRVKTAIEVQGIIDKNTEYALILSLTDSAGTYRYYTRIMEPVGADTADCVAFAVDFHEKALNPETYETLATYLEPDSSGDNTTLHKVTINSSLKQVGWADFGGAELTPPVPRIMETNSSYTVVLLDFVMTRVAETGETEYYNCEEYFRVRHTTDRDYLLNYERTMDQIYRGENAYFYGNYIQLGIRDENVQFLANEPETAIAFVQEGELWCLNPGSGRLYQVYGFRSLEGIDERENYGEHGIKIVSIDEEGSINFVVYGYMNRGEHEGTCGIGVYHFNSVTNTVEEEAFLPSNQSFQVLQSDIGSLMYESEGDQFYLMLGGSVYRIDLSTRRVTELLSGLIEGAYAISESNRYLAYQSEGELYNSTELTIYDFETNTSYAVAANNGEYLLPLGFMQEDLIFGKAWLTDVLTDSAGTVTFPMYKVVIMSTGTDHATLKEYSKQGYYVSDIYVEAYTIYLNRLQFNGTAFVAAEQDTIMNREGNSMETVVVHTTVTAVKETEVQIALSADIGDTSPKMLTPKEIVAEDDRTVELAKRQENPRFYVYAKGKVELSTFVLRDAVGRANDDMGVVIGDDCEYLWKRARASSKTSIPIDEEIIAENTTSISKCLGAMLEIAGSSIDVESMLNSGQTPREILRSSLKDARFMDLSGCDVDEILYYISCNAPVFALSGANDAVLIVGYDSNSITLYDPLVGGKRSMSFDEAEETFAAYGDVFFTYLSM